VGQQGSIPAKIRGVVDVDVTPEQVNRTWTVTARVKEVRDVKVQLGRLPQVVRKLAEDEVAEQVRGALRELPDWSMSAIDGSSLPVRAARVAPSRAGIRVEMLTESPSPVPVAAQAKLTEGWRLDVSQDSLVDLARAEAFRAGPVSHDVVVDPTDLRIGHGTFELDLRLWKTTGSGWWRDYTVQGSLAKGADRFALKARDVEQTGASEGAALADPLAYLGEGVILSSIADNVRAAFPAGTSAFAGGRRWSSRIRTISGEGERLTVTGDIVVDKLKKRDTSSKRPPGPGRR
jgi:hypothetical protein